MRSGLECPGQVWVRALAKLVVGTGFGAEGRVLDVAAGAGWE